MRKFLLFIVALMLVQISFAQEANDVEKKQSTKNLSGSTPRIQCNDIIWYSDVESVNMESVPSGFVEVVVRDKNTNGIVHFEVFESIVETINLENYLTDEYVIEVYAITERKN